MNREEISNALNGIDEKYIEQAADDLPVHRQTRSWAKRLIPLAACFAVVLSVGLYRTYLNGSLKQESVAGNEQSGESAAPSDQVASSGGTEGRTSTVVVKVQGDLVDGFTGAVVETDGGSRYPVGTKVQVYFKEHDAQTESYEGANGQENGKKDHVERLVRVRFSTSEAGADDAVLFAEEIEILN